MDLNVPENLLITRKLKFFFQKDTQITTKIAHIGPKRGSVKETQCICSLTVGNLVIFMVNNVNLGPKGESVKRAQLTCSGIVNDHVAVKVRFTYIHKKYLNF